MKTLFEQIIERDLPATIEYEDEDFIVIQDKYPKAPVHLLLITKKVIPDLQSLAPEDARLIGKLAQLAQKMAKQFGVEKEGYRLVVNNGPNAGQMIFHLHFHLLGGKTLGGIG